MINFKKDFAGGINSDDDVRAMAKSDYLNMENARVGVNKQSRSLAIYNIPSTIRLFQQTLSGTNKVIGTCKDLSRNRIIWANYNSDGEHAFYCYDKNAKTTYTILLSSQTAAGLNFLLSHPIDRNMRVVGDLLIGTDDNNEPFCINIEAGIKLNHPDYETNIEPYSTPIPYTTLTLIRKPPIRTLIITKENDPDFVNNYITNEAFQFFYRFQYKNYQYSANSAISRLAPFNFKADNYNYVNLKVSLLEKIDDYVLSIELCVRFGNKGKSFIIKRWTKEDADDASAIDDHNAGSTQLEYNFYNNRLDAALSDIEASNSFDNISLKAKTFELAKNRGFFANFLKGYNTPTTTSLSLTLPSPVSTTVCHKSGSSYRVSIVFFDRFMRPTGRVEKSVAVDIPYRSKDQTTFIAAIDWALNNANALNEIPVEAYYYQTCISINQNRTFFLQTIAKEITYVKKKDDGAIVDAGVVFDNNDTYALAIDVGNLLVQGQGYSFNEGDFAVLQTQNTESYNLKVLGQSGNKVWLTPVNLTGGYSRYFWESPSASRYEDPNRYFFRINFTSSKNPSASIVTQSITTIGDAITIDNTKTNWVMQFLTTTADRKFQINISAINFKCGNVGQVGKFYIRAVATHPTLANIEVPVYTKECNGSETYDDTGLGYITVPAGYQKLFLYLSSDLPHIYVNKINLDIDEAPITLSMIELYTPYAPNESEPFYGVGNVMVVNNPGTSGRQYATLSGTIPGDSYILDRTIDIDENTSYSFKVEAMSPNDLTWNRWERNLGWPTFIDKIGQQRTSNAIEWSDTYINGAKTNNLNKFQPLNVKDTGSSTGGIQKIQLAGKTQEDGSIMLILTDEQAISAYLGEVSLYAAAQQANIIKSDEVISGFNAMRNGCGTLHPESVVEYNGVVWWWSVLQQAICQYSTNGIDRVSNFKFKRFTEQFSTAYNNKGKAAIEALGGFANIVSCIDPANNELLFVLPQTEDNDYVKTLPSYSTLPDYASSIQNRFEMYDGQAKIIAYNYTRNRTTHVYKWLPERLEYIGNELYGFKNGNLYLHNEGDTFNTIYDEEYPVRVCFSCNVDVTAIVNVTNIAIEGNGVKPDFTVLYAGYPNEQITDLINSDYAGNEGVLYAKFFRDRLSPNATGTPEEKMRTGDRIKSNSPFIMVEFQAYSGQVVVNFVDVGFKISGGHSTIIKP